MSNKILFLIVLIILFFIFFRKKKKGTGTGTGTGYTPVPIITDMNVNVITTPTSGGTSFLGSSSFGALAPNGKIYYPPGTTGVTNVMAYNPVTNSIEVFGTITTVSWIWKGLVDGDKIYYGSYNGLLIIDTVNNLVTIDDSQTWSYNLYKRGDFVMSEYDIDTNTVSLYNTINDTASSITIDTELPLTGSEGPGNEGFTLPNGDIFYAKGAKTDVSFIFKTDNTVEQFPMSVDYSYIFGPGYNVSGSDKVYFMGDDYFGNDLPTTILEYNITSNTTREIDVGSTVGYYTEGVIAGDDKIIFVSLDDTELLIIDKNGVISTTPIPNVDVTSWSSIFTLPNGYIVKTYMLNDVTNQLMFINPDDYSSFTKSVTETGDGAWIYDGVITNNGKMVFGASTTENSLLVIG